MMILTSRQTDTVLTSDSTVGLCWLVAGWETNLYEIGIIHKYQVVGPVHESTTVNFDEENDEYYPHPTKPCCELFPKVTSVDRVCA